MVLDVDDPAVNAPQHTPFVSDWEIPKHNPPAGKFVSTLGLHVMMEEPINIEHLSTLSNIPMEDMNAILGGNYVLGDNPYSKCNDLFIRQIVVGLLKYKYPEKVEVIDAMVLFETNCQSKLFSVMSNQSTQDSIADAKNMVICIINFLDVLKNANFTEPFKLDEFCIVRRITMHYDDGSKGPTQIDRANLMFNNINHLLRPLGIIILPNYPHASALYDCPPFNYNFS